MIRRAPRRRRFLVVDSATVEDDRLSFRALGLLAFLLSKPDSWEVSSEQLGRERREGRDAIRAAMRELQAAGYLSRKTERDSNGQLRTVTIVDEVPATDSQAPVIEATEAFTSPQVTPETDRPAPGQPGSGQPVALSNTDLAKEQLPTAVPANAGATGEVVPLRSERAAQAAADTLARLKAEVEAGRRSWSLSEAATTEWLALLDDVDTNVGPAQQFVVWYVAANAGIEVRELAPIHWQRAAQTVRRWRGLVLYGVDQAVTRLHPNDEDKGQRPGRAFWAYVEKVCQSTHDRSQEGSAG